MKNKLKKDPKYLRALQEREAALHTVNTLLKGDRQYALQSWLRHFDKTQDNEILMHEFHEGLKSLNYKGITPPDILFQRIDLDSSQVITFDEIDEEASKIWMQFRLWCVGHFHDPEDLVSALSNGGSQVFDEQFLHNLPSLGWTRGHEPMIFSCLNMREEPCITAKSFRFWLADKKKHERKVQARLKASIEQMHRTCKRQKCEQAVQDFKTFLKRKYSNLLRAWRRALDLDRSMTIQKSELFKAVRELNWEGDVRMLWKGLDKDGSGIVSLQELDLRVAELLAKFKEFVTQEYGSCEVAFNAFDITNKRKMNEHEFISACRRNGFQKANRALFQGLDWQRHKYIVEDDITFLDSWRYPVHLTCSPNAKAAADFKEHLLEHYKHYVKAWRFCLDRDDSNCVAWEEFQAAAKKVDFTGDLPGAWRFLDDDLSGSISLREIDPDSFDLLLEFKIWADAEFGGIRSAFQVMDGADNVSTKAGEMSMREFRKELSRYGFQGNMAALFQALDTDQQGLLTLDEVAFLDAWDLRPEHLEGLQVNEKVAKDPDNGSKAASTKIVPCTPRIAELAVPKPRLPALSGDMFSFNSESLLSLKPKINRCPYGKLPGITGVPMEQSTRQRSPSPRSIVLPNLMRLESIEAAKNEILRQAVIKEDRQLNGKVECDIASIKSKTMALRNRTIELLGKVDKFDKDSCSNNDVMDGDFLR